MNEPIVPPNTYLEFGSVGDYLDHLRIHNIRHTRCELNFVLSGTENSNAAVYAALTMAIKTGYIATCGIWLLSLHKREIEANQHKIDEAFHKVKENLREKGFEPLPGIRKYEPPSYLN